MHYVWAFLFTNVTRVLPRRDNARNCRDYAYFIETMLAQARAKTIAKKKMHNTQLNEKMHKQSRLYAATGSSSSDNGDDDYCCY